MRGSGLKKDDEQAVRVWVVVRVATGVGIVRL